MESKPYGPNPLGGAQITVINGTNWDRKRWADGSTPAILYNITTPESLPYAGRASFIVPNTTNARYKRLKPSKLTTTPLGSGCAGMEYAGLQRDPCSKLLITMRGL